MDPGTVCCRSPERWGDGPRHESPPTDEFLAVLALAQVWLTLDEGVSPPLAALFTATTALAYDADEHGVLDRLPGTRLHQTVALVAVAGTGIVALGLGLEPDAAETVLLASLAGLGGGILLYRCYFGLVRPVPETRLRRASKRQV